MTLLSVAFSVAIQFAISFAFALGGLALALRVAGVRSPRVRAAVWLLPFLKAAWDLAGVDLGCWALAQGFDLAHRAPGSLVLSVGLGLRDFLVPLLTVGLSAPGEGSRLLPGDVLYYKLGSRVATAALAAAAALAVGRMLFVLIGHARAMRELYRLEECSAPLGDERLRGQPRVRRQLEAAGLTVRVVPGELAPVLVGWRRPRVLLGRVLVESLSSQELAGILGHELGHLERRDPLLRPLLAAAGAVAGFVPGVAHALGRWALEAEKACDRRGVAAGVPARVMARALEKSHSICTATRTGLLPALSAFRSGLGQRVEALVDHRTLSSRRLRTAAALFLAAGTFASRIGVW